MISQRRAELLHGGFISVPNGHVRAAVDQALDTGLADASGTTCNDGVFTREIVLDLGSHEEYAETSRETRFYTINALSVQSRDG